MVCDSIIEHSGYPFCLRHIPQYGDRLILHDGKTVVYCGTIRLSDVIRDLFARKSLVRWWWGTDALTLHSFPPGLSRWRILLHRIKSRLLKPIFKNWTFGPGLIEELNRCGYSVQSVVVTPPHHTKLYRGPVLFVGVYVPNRSEYSRWKYGLDIVDQVKACFQGDSSVMFIEFGRDGKLALQLMNCYIRPSRHDGFPRLILACKANGISYYYKENFRHNVSEIVHFIQAQKQIYFTNLRGGFASEYSNCNFCTR
jgi:hypothetical protein